MEYQITYTRIIELHVVILFVLKVRFGSVVGGASSKSHPAQLVTRPATWSPPVSQVVRLSFVRAR
jgi:hypothetical protein